LPLLFFGGLIGFCINPLVWPRIKPLFQRFKHESKKDRRIRELEDEVKRLKWRINKENAVI
jgi:hypothetical protein